MIKMRKKFFMFFILIMSCLPVSAANYPQTIKSGLWEIYGSGFAEKEFVRVSLELEGDMNLRFQNVQELDEDVATVIQDGEEVSRTSITDKIFAITSYDVNLELEATGLGIKVWSENLPNGIKIPIILSKTIPTDNYPFILPSVTFDEITYTVTFTSESSGKLRIKGYTDVDTVGKCEVNADCTVWKSGTKTPGTEDETKSGCNVFSWNIFAFALIIWGGLKFVRN